MHLFPSQCKEGVITRFPFPGKQIWISAFRRNGKTIQVSIYSHHGEHGNKEKQEIKFAYPFGADSATWNYPIERDGDIVTLQFPWHRSLIGEIMDVNEGADKADATRKKLGVIDPMSKNLPVIYSSGDSISLGYWPYLESELWKEANVYYQRELAKDMPNIALVNNGHANLAYGVLQAAYKNEDFKPDYLMVNFGLHMIGGYSKNLPGYREWVEKFIAFAKEKKVKLIFVNTTPYQQSYRPEQNRTIIKFNEVVKAAAEKNNVSVIDLHTCVIEAVRELGDIKVYTDGCHFTDEMKNKQAKFIAKRVREIHGKK